MPLVKILITTGEYDRDHDDYRYHYSKDLTNWEEVSDDDYQFLKKYADLLPYKDKTYTDRVIILSQDDVLVTDRIAELRERLKDQLLAEQAHKAKQLLAAEKAKKDRLIQKKAQELKTFEKLQVKYGNSK